MEESRKCNDFTEISFDFLVDLIHSALQFEDPSIKTEDVYKVLKGDYTGVNSEKVIDITNQKNAFNKVVSMVKNKEEMTENALKDLHQILCEGTNIVGGLYRNVNISVKGSNHTPCDYLKVYDRMGKYFDYLAYESGNEWEFISYSHLQLAKIRPFLDANGRLARLVLNYELMKHNYKPVIITRDEKEEYLKVLETFKVEKEIKPFMDFLEKLELESLERK